MTPLDETPGSTWIAVPTYWTFLSTEPAVALTVFDHPTPLDEEGTLARTLESFLKPVSYTHLTLPTN